MRPQGDKKKNWKLLLPSSLMFYMPEKSGQSSVTEAE